jgi:hypothetical protein
MSAKKTLSRRQHRPVPYPLIEQMWKKGASYTAIAKRIRRWDESKDDPSQSTRAIVSNMLRLGYRNGRGKLVKLPMRKGMRNRGVGQLLHRRKEK